MGSGKIAVMENKIAGRRPRNEETRERILSAACTRFGDVGFEATTIRSVAAEAEVDPALVMHYFKTSKAFLTQLSQACKNSLGGWKM